MYIHTYVHTYIYIYKQTNIRAAAAARKRWQRGLHAACKKLQEKEDVRGGRHRMWNRFSVHICGRLIAVFCCGERQRGERGTQMCHMSHGESESSTRRRSDYDDDDSLTTMCNCNTIGLGGPSDEVSSSALRLFQVFCLFPSEKNAIPVYEAHSKTEPPIGYPRAPPDPFEGLPPPPNKVKPPIG